MKRSVAPHSPPPRYQQDNPALSLPDREKEQALGQQLRSVQELYQAGDYVRAQAAAQAAAEAAKAHFGDDHPAVAAAYSNVALCAKQLGDFDASRRHYRTALRVYRRTVGEQHASFAAVLHNLGQLNVTQIHVDASLSASDRAALLQQAHDYLQSAYTVRVDELGDAHVHTVASQSALGSVVALQILASYKKQAPTSANAAAAAAAATGSTYISHLPTAVTEPGWRAAQQHLQEALRTAMDQPRGKALSRPKRASSKAAKTTTVTTPVAKTANDVHLELDRIQTLSAASAAQNLAVFWKLRATTAEASPLPPLNVDGLLATTSSSTVVPTTSSGRDIWLLQAHDLYQRVLDVRRQLLPPNHAEVYATMHSLAELLETMGRVEQANALRRQLVDTYDPPEEDQ
jgi:tetratricopeptide (TPR) repeat protein